MGEPIDVIFPPYPCPMCEEKFNTYEELDVHATAEGKKAMAEAMKFWGKPHDQQG